MKRILLISPHIPAKDHAGGLRLLDLYSELLKIQPDLHITLVSVRTSGIEIDLSTIFDEVYLLDQNQFNTAEFLNLTLNFADFDLIDLAYHQSGGLISACRKRWPQAKLVFSPMEAQSRSLAIWLSGGLSRAARCWRMTAGLLRNSVVEALYMWRADKVVAVSDADQISLAQFGGKSKVLSLPTCLSSLEFRSPEAVPFPHDSQTVVFFAYFGSVSNCEALRWYVQEVHPLVSQAVPTYRFRVVGRGLSEEMRHQFDDSAIEIVGEVPTVLDGLRDAAVGIAPALRGAGIRGKIHQYAALGIPCVASPIACESLSYQDGESILVAENSQQFADSCIRLLKDVELRNSIGNNASVKCHDGYVWSSWWSSITAIYELSA